LLCISHSLNYLDDDDIPPFFFDVEVDYIIVVTISCDVPTTVLIQSSQLGVALPMILAIATPM
jgi:hypothetical protein